MARALDLYRVELLAKITPERPPTPPSPAGLLSSARQFGTTQATLCSAARLAAAQHEHEREHPWRSAAAAASAAGRGRCPSEADDYIRLGDTDTSSCDLSHSGELDRGSSCASAGTRSVGTNATGSGPSGYGLGARAGGGCSTGGGSGSSGRLQLQPLPSRRSSCSNTLLGAAAHPSSFAAASSLSSRSARPSEAVVEAAAAGLAVGDQNVGVRSSIRRGSSSWAMARDLDQPAVAAGSSHGTRAVSFADRRTCSRIQQQACGIEGVLVGMPSGSGDSSSDDDEAPSSMFLAAAERHDGRHAVGHSSGGVDRTSNGSSSGAVPALQLLAQQPAGPRPCAAPSSQRRQLQVQSRRGGVSHTLLPPPPPPFAWEYSRGVGACAETRGVGGGEAAGMFCSEGANAVWHAPAPQPPLPPPGHRRPGCRRATLDGEGVPCAAHEAQEHGSSGADVCADGAIVVGGEFVGGWDVPCHQQTPSQQLQQSNMISSSKLQAAAPASSSHSGRAGGTLRPVLRSGPSGTAAAGAAGPWPARPAQTLSRLHDGGSRRNSGSNVAIAVVPAAAAGSGSTGSGEARDAPAAMASSGGRSAAGPLGVAAAGTPAAVAPRELRRFASHSSTSQTATAAPAAAAAAAAAGASGAPVSWAHPAVARQLGRGGMAAPAPPATAATATASAATSGALAAARLAATAATVAAESVSAPLPLLQHTQQQHIARQHCPPTHATTPGGEHDSTPVPTPHHVQQYLQAVAAGARGGAQQLHACAEAAAAVAIAPGQQPSGAGWSATAAATAAGALPVSSRRFSRRSLDETVLARAASSHSSRSACSNGSGRGGGNARLQVQQPHWAAGAGAAGAAPSACALDAAAPAATAATGSPFLGQRRGSVGALKPSPMAPGTLAAVPSLTAIGVEDMDVGNAGGDGGGVGAWNGACIDAGAVTSVGTGGRMIAKLLKALSDFRAGE